MPEVEAYMEVVEDACARPGQRPSIVNLSIVSALEGRYGDHHRTERTADSTLWINPLMGQYWFFEAPAVAARVEYLEHLKPTRSFMELAQVIEGYRKGLAEVRPFQRIPV